MGRDPPCAARAYRAHVINPRAVEAYIRRGLPRKARARPAALPRASSALEDRGRGRAGAPGLRGPEGRARRPPRCARGRGSGCAGPRRLPHLRGGPARAPRPVSRGRERWKAARGCGRRAVRGRAAEAACGGWGEARRVPGAGVSDRLGGGAGRSSEKPAEKRVGEGRGGVSAALVSVWHHGGVTEAAWSTARRPSTPPVPLGRLRTATGEGCG